MVHDQRSRVDDALTSLVKLYLPPHPNEDDEAANDRREDAHDAIRCIIEEDVSLPRIRSQTG